MSPRTVLKRTVELSLAHGGPAWLARSLTRSRPLILAYHDVGLDGAPPAGDASLHLPRAHFAEQLDLLMRTHEVVPLEGLLADPRPSGGRPRAAITFDDAYLGAVTLGVTELAQRGLPATIFVAPALLGGGAPWWDALLGHAPAARTRDHALDELRGEAAAIRAWARALRIEEAQLPGSLRIATEGELQEAMEYEGITLGAHGWDHPNLARLDEAELRVQLKRPLAWLRERFARVIPWLAYPYGLASPAVERAAAAAGYHGALLVSGGAVRARRANRFALPRLNVPAGLSREGFMLRTAGLLRS